MNFDEPVMMPADEFCSRIVHSFIFLPVINIQGSIDSFYFTSDTHRKKALWITGVADVAHLITVTGKDFPSTGVFKRANNGELVVWSGHGDPPKHMR